MLKSTFFLLIFVCVCTSFAAEPEWAKQQVILDNFVWDSTKPFYGKQLTDIRGFGRLERESSKPYTSGLVDSSRGATTHEFIFSGVQVVGFFIPGDRFFLRYVEVTTPTYFLAKGLRVGSPKAEVEKLLGLPSQVLANSFEYNGETESAIFHFKEGKVVRVELHVYAD